MKQSSTTTGEVLLDTMDENGDEAISRSTIKYDASQCPSQKTQVKVVLIK